ncbi:MAG: BNR-4 repeat-containing protein [Phycisphaeraceae bacterium]|nr:BNR-4 repeat-containing protein [Phycisphaeraceae bacterium]
MIELSDNGGWCWYQDPRVIVDRQTGRIIFSSIPSTGGANGARRAGDIDVTCHDPATGRTETVAVGQVPTYLDSDDHNVAAIWQRPDGRFLVMYTGHNHGRNDRLPKTFYRISRNPHDATDWLDEQSFDWPTDDPVGNDWVAVTYSNIHYLSAEGGAKGRLYNIARASGQTWRMATSDDWGETWTYRGILTLPPAGGRAYSNGYPKFCDNGVDRIDFIITEAHPRDYNNGIYHGYIRGSKSFDAAGRVIDPDLFSDRAPLPERFTPLFRPRDVAENAHHTAWTAELSRDSAGCLHALFTTRFGTGRSPIQKRNKPAPGDADHRLFYARLDGDRWRTTELCRMGPGLYDSEEDYTGLGAIDPRDGRTVYISTPIDPRDDTPLAHHELFEGMTRDSGKTWTWSPVTEASTVDNLRPRLVRLNDGRAMLLWLRGAYRTMHDFDLKVVARYLDQP